MLFARNAQLVLICLNCADKKKTDEIMCIMQQPEFLGYQQGNQTCKYMHMWCARIPNGI